MKPNLIFLSVLASLSCFQPDVLANDYGSFYDQFVANERTDEQYDQYLDSTFLPSKSFDPLKLAWYQQNPDDNNGDGFSGKDIEETLQLLQDLYAKGIISFEVLSFWESILGKELSDQGYGPSNYWNPSDGIGFDAGRDSGNPGDGDYADLNTLLKLAKEAGGQSIVGAEGDGPAWGYNGDSPEDWANHQQGGGTNDDNNDNDQDLQGAGSTDDGSVKGPVEIVDPAYVRE